MAADKNEKNFHLIHEVLNFYTRLLKYYNDPCKNKQKLTPLQVAKYQPNRNSFFWAIVCCYCRWCRRCCWRCCCRWCRRCCCRCCWCCCGLFAICGKKIMTQNLFFAIFICPFSRSEKKERERPRLDLIFFIGGWIEGHRSVFSFLFHYKHCHVEPGAKDMVLWLMFRLYGYIKARMEDWANLMRKAV